MTIGEFERLTDSVCNWGRWGHEDQRGTLNLLNSGSVLRGVQAVVSGDTIPLALPLGLRGPQLGSVIPARINPIRTMIAINVPCAPDPAPTFSDDIVIMPTQAATHWDALAHTAWRGKMYNDTPVSAVDHSGATRLGIDQYGCVVSRGVMLDIPAALGMDILEPQTPITRAILEACIETESVEIRPGDILLIRTGTMSYFKAGDSAGYAAKASGLVPSAASLFHELDVAAVASDTKAFELVPSSEPDLFIPVHILTLVMMGMPIGENWDLEALAVQLSGAQSIYVPIARDA